VLIKQLQTLTLNDTAVVYNIRFRAFLGDKMIRFGEWANDQHIRLYNRTHVAWNEAAVHEGLDLSRRYKNSYDQRRIYPSLYFKEHRRLCCKNGELCHAECAEILPAGKKASWIQCRVAPTFSFIKNYLFRLGFLDGEAGFTVAKMNAWYTWLKYARLRELGRDAEPAA
jgi:hypothetical protein